MNIEGINQVQTNSEIGLTFATALRSILRQDPNVIMIGEIRDTETARIAVRASITGHIVLSTIHTNSSLNTIERLLDMDVERYLLASSLEGIISQKLARKLCPNCRHLRKTNDYEKEMFKKVLHRNVDEIYSAEGCEVCGSGYKGRIAIHEVLIVDQKIKDAISSNLRKEQLRRLVYTSDVTTLLQDGLEKVAEGYTTFEEVLKLIEFENSEEDHGSTYDLNSALEYTNLSQEEKIKEKEEIILEEEPVTEKNIKSNKKEEPAPVIEKKVDDDWGMDFDTSDNIEKEVVKEEKSEPIMENEEDDDLLSMEF